MTRQNSLFEYKAVLLKSNEDPFMEAELVSVKNEPILIDYPPNNHFTRVNINSSHYPSQPVSHLSSTTFHILGNDSLFHNKYYQHLSFPKQRIKKEPPYYDKVPDAKLKQ